MTVIAQDPSVEGLNGGVLTVSLDVPLERLAPGPRGSRVHVIDYDVSNNVLYRPTSKGLDKDHYVNMTDRDRLISDRNFHSLNVYAIVMTTLARFENALGRRAPFSFPGGGLYPGAAPGRGHVIKVAPHAFVEANAFYSRRDEGLFFGYFTSGKKTIFTCLSYDVIAHETTHSLLDGLRSRYMDRSSPDQAAFHEGFADVIAILSVFQNSKVIDASFPKGRKGKIAPGLLSSEKLRRSFLVGVADEMGQELKKVRGNPLRNSALLKPSPRYLEEDEFKEEHRRGEIFVAAMLNAFLEVWRHRLWDIGLEERISIDRDRVVKEGAEAASHLLTMAIRAIDYAPPVDLQFGDFLTALLTADHELYPDDSRYKYRAALEKAFVSFGIKSIVKSGMWNPPKTSLRCNHFDSLKREPDEAFAFLWENQKRLELHPDAYTYVPSVRPCSRVDTDGFILHETIVEYVQILDLKAGELSRLRKVRKPNKMPNTEHVRLYGGGVLVFDEFGSLKYHVNSKVDSEKQTKRLKYLWNRGDFNQPQALRRFATLHRMRMLGGAADTKEKW